MRILRAGRPHPTDEEHQDGARGAEPRPPDRRRPADDVDARTNLAHQVVDEVRAFFGDQVFHNVIPRNVRLSEAPSFGLPVTLYAPKSTGAEAYAAVAEEVLSRG